MHNQQNIADIPTSVSYPQSPRFHPWPTPAQLTKLRALAAEQQRLIELGDEYSVSSIRRAIREAREDLQANPSEEKFYDLQGLLDYDPNDPAGYMRGRILRRAGYTVAWAFFLGTVKGFLGEMMADCIAQIREEQMRQRELNSLFAELFACYGAWAAHYGAGFATTPSIHAILEAQIETMQKVLAGLPATEGTGVPPPLAETARLIFGIDTSEAGVAID